MVVSGCGAAQEVGEALDNRADTNAPVAVVNSEIKVGVKSNVIVDGSRSYDPNDLSLTYEWTLADIPIGSSAALGTSAFSASASIISSPSLRAIGFRERGILRTGEVSQ